MDLSEFITNTLVSLIKGVSKAQEKIGGSAEINPVGIHLSETSGPTGRASGNRTPIQNVDFDIVVEAREGTTTEGNIGVVTAMLSAGAKSEALNETSNANRIRFSIPIALPTKGER